MRRTGPTNSEGVAANNDNRMQHHVMDVHSVEESLLVRGIVEMITKGDGIFRCTRILGLIMA
jgi:hypothetical protein